MTDAEVGLSEGATPTDRQPGSIGPDRMTTPVSQPQDDARWSPETARLSGGERARMVPYGALAEERARRRDLQRELRESRDARQRLQALLEGRQDPPQARPEANAGEALPDAAEAASGAGRDDPAGSVEGQAIPPEDYAATQEERAFRTQILQSVRSYVRAQPDFMDAYQHARQARIEELSELGYSADEAAAITFDNEAEVIRNAYATGRNPAQVIYDYALTRGYPGKGAASQPPVSAPLGGAAARPAEGGMTEAEKVALAARGQAGSKSLSSAGGGALGTLTLEALASLADDEFAEATKGDRWQRLLRGS